MIHYWECKRCTHQWQSCCFGHMFMSEEEKALHDRKPYELCDACFLEFEKQDGDLLHVLQLKQRLDKKDEQLNDVIENLAASLKFGYKFKLEDHFKSLTPKGGENVG